MPRTIPSLLPRLARLLQQLGSNLKLARLRRRYPADLVAQRAGIARRTLSKVEQGDPAVAIGIYTRVLQVLRLEQDLALVAADDELGRKLQDLGIVTKQRAPRTKTGSPPENAEPEGDPETEIQDDGGAV